MDHELLFGSIIESSCHSTVAVRRAARPNGALAQKCCSALCSVAARGQTTLFKHAMGSPLGQRRQVDSDDNSCTVIRPIDR